MDTRVEQLLNKTKGKRVSLFVDNANWFYPQHELGWRVSYSRLRDFLKQFYTPAILKLYAGTPLDNKDRLTFDRFVQAVSKADFSVITKPLKKIWVDRAKTKYEYKCNFDVEIALDVARHLDETDVVIIGSGDSDFLEVKNYAMEHSKIFMVLCFEKGIAWEMRKGYHLFLEDIREFIENK